jgi:hypothetical protein
MPPPKTSGSTNPFSYNTVNAWLHQPHSTTMGTQFLSSLTSNLRLASTDHQSDTTTSGTNMFARLLASQADKYQTPQLTNMLINTNTNNDRNAHTIINVGSRTDLKGFLNKNTAGDQMLIQDDNLSSNQRLLNDQALSSTNLNSVLFNHATTIESDVPSFPLKPVSNYNPLVHSLANSRLVDTIPDLQRHTDFKSATSSSFHNPLKTNVVLAQTNNTIPDGDSTPMGIIVQKGPPLST